MRIGILQISEKKLLELLQFEGGIIRDIRLSSNWGDIEITIEHGNMPIISKGEQMQKILSIYDTDGYVVNYTT